ncbi:MAG: gfo/Idh/MocA family oxidoreductase, partial [Lachnospiraceae bacterium]|nr:gfo/Idh/MocA family oxidoreductase [Lachnospiraceae bacterium]
VPEQINGYEYEVLSCRDALKEGRIECPEMPHRTTLQIMRLMDGLRKKWGIPEF